MRVNNDLGIFDFDDFAMEMTSTELLLVNGGACGGGFSGGSCGGGGGNAGSYSSGSSSASSGCGGSSGSDSGSSGSSVSNSCGGSFNGGSGTSVSYGNCGGGTIPTSNNCGGGYTGSGPSYTSSGCGGENSEPIYGAPADYTSRATYTNQLENINSKNTSYGDITLGVNLNLVGCIGFDISFGILINLDNATQSGIFFTGGFAAGTSAGASVFAGYTPGKFLDENAATLSLGLGSIGGNIGFSSDGTISGGISGSLPIGIDAGFNISKQYGFVIPFDTPEQREKSMKLYYEHH